MCAQNTCFLRKKNKETLLTSTLTNCQGFFIIIVHCMSSCQLINVFKSIIMFDIENYHNANLLLFRL